MHQLFTRLTNTIGRLWKADKPLTTVGLLMAAVGIATTIGLAVDPRVIAGAPAWLKPTKFAVSTAIYTFTLAWVFGFLRDWVRTRKVVGRVTAAVIVLEVALISLQAWRGTTSHFNTRTPLDMAIFSAMGLAIIVQTTSTVWVVFALWRQRFADAAMGWAVRLGMAITIVGALSGGLMTRPTADQLAEARATHRMPTSGAHTIGAPDGGAGLPVTGWSARHGDLRVAHFLGLHALQVLPLLAVILRRRRVETMRRARFVVVAGASYVSLFAMLLWQALRGEALIEPGALTLAVAALWAVATFAAAIAARTVSEDSVEGAVLSL